MRSLLSIKTPTYLSPEGGSSEESIGAISEKSADEQSPLRSSAEQAMTHEREDEEAWWYEKELRRWKIMLHRILQTIIRLPRAVWDTCLDTAADLLLFPILIIKILLKRSELRTERKREQAEATRSIQLRRGERIRYRHRGWNKFPFWPGKPAIADLPFKDFKKDAALRIYLIEHSAHFVAEHLVKWVTHPLMG